MIGARTASGVRRISVTVAVCCAALLALSGNAFGRTIQLYGHTGAIDGTGSTAGTIQSQTGVAVHQGDGKVFVLDDVRLDGSFSQFDPEGTPIPFSSLQGSSSIAFGGDPAFEIAVDSSTGLSNGNIYVDNGKNVIKGFSADGTELGPPFPLSGFRESCGIAVDPQGYIWIADSLGSRLVQFSPIGSPTGKSVSVPRPCSVAIDSAGDFYVSENSNGIKKYSPSGSYLYSISGLAIRGITVDRTNDHVFAYESTSPYSQVTEYDAAGNPLGSFGDPDFEHGFEGFEDSAPVGIAVDENTHKVYVGNPHSYGDRKHLEVFSRSEQVVVPSVSTDPPTLGTHNATLRGAIDLDGAGATTECIFEWGTSAYYDHTLPCDPSGAITDPGVHGITAELSGLIQGTVYHYRLTARNANGIRASGADRSFRPQGPATISGEIVSDVNTDGARISARIDPNGGDTTYQVEYGAADCATSECADAPATLTSLANPDDAQTVSVVLTGLHPASEYHYRVVAKNDLGEVEGDGGVFRTYAVDATQDACSNALVRKQTGAVLLPDCRAYEIVSASMTGGYDVRSDLAAGEEPFQAVPGAKDALLYSLNYGRVPGVSGEPTNHGMDPYVARRSPHGWVTDYAGIPVGGPPLQGPFASTPSEYSGDLSAMAFGGDEICSPCFADGKTGIPVRRVGGAVVQGMAGSLDPGPTATPDGYVAKQLSANGAHLVFGSASRFEPEGNGNGDVSIYDRNLLTNTTHVVSLSPAGANLTCLQGQGSCHGPGDPNGIGALDISADGSKIVVAQRVSTDAAGNVYWHPYMNTGDAGQTVDLAPGSTSGVLFDGMTNDGAAVYFTSVDKLTSDDHDSSPDIFRAVVSGGNVTLSRVSVGSSGTGDTDSCDPAPGIGSNWNSVGASSVSGCGAVALAGGSGLAHTSGAIYFLSPEKLSGGAEGVENAPNLYLATMDGQVHFVATLEPANEAVTNAVEDSSVRSYGDFQVTPSGDVAVFSSYAPLTGFPSFGHSAIFRYATSGSVLECVSCPATGAGLTTDSYLSRYGSNLSDDGRVFFSSSEPLVLRDTGGTADVYEWSEGKTGLISSGRSGSDASLVTASADGVDAFFFTRDTLVAGDQNGPTMKVYDARQGGGFLATPTAVPCKASDECHGPGSAGPTSSPIGTYEGTGGNAAEHQKHKKVRRKHHKRKRRHGHHRSSSARRAQ